MDFEDWYDDKIAGNAGNKLARYRPGEKATKQTGKDLKGDQLADGARDTERPKAPSFAQSQKRRVTSDRKLISDG